MTSHEKPLSLSPTHTSTASPKRPPISPLPVFPNGYSPIRPDFAETSPPPLAIGDEVIHTQIEGESGVGDEEKAPSPASSPIDKYEKWREQRWYIVVLVSIPCLVVTMAGSAVIPSLDSIKADFAVSDTQVSLVPSVWVVFQAIFSIILSPVSDVLSRRYMYLVCLGLYISLTILCGFSWNFYSLLFFRALCAACCSPLVNMGSASISDVFPPLERGTALSWFALSPLMGPILGPLVGGFVVNYLSWHSLFWIIGGVGIPMWILQFFFLPETLDKSGPPRAYDPFLPVKLWFHAELWPLFGISACFGALFAIFVLFGLVAPERYDLTPLVAGILTALFGLGCFTGSQLGGRMSDHLARRFGIGGRLISVVFNLFFIIIPTFAFCKFLEINLYVTIVALFFSGFCLSLPRSGALTFAIEKVPGNAAGVSCSFTSLQFGLAFLCVSAAAYVYENYGLMYFAYLVLPIYLLFGVANARLLYRYMTSYYIVDVNETERHTETGGEGGEGGDEEKNVLDEDGKEKVGQDIELREKSPTSSSVTS